MQDKKSFDFVRFVKSQMLLVAGIVIFLIFGMIEHSFFTQSNIITIFRQIAVIAVMGSGMTYAIIGGNFDQVPCCPCAARSSSCRRIRWGLSRPSSSHCSSAAHRVS